MKRTRLLARVSDPDVRFVYIVGQSGSGRNYLLTQMAEIYSAGSVSYLPAWDELTVGEAVQYRALLETPDTGKIVVAVGTDPSVAHPFGDKAPAHVCSFDDADLAFKVEEIAELLSDAAAGSDIAQFIYEQTAGYSAAVVFMRRVLRAEGESVVYDLNSNAYAPLRRYIYDRIIATLPSEELAVLITAAAIGGTRPQELREALPACNIEACVRNLQRRRLLIERDGRLIIVPVLLATLNDLCREDLRAYAISTIDSLLEQKDYASAATIAINFGRPDDAAQYLLEAPEELLLRPNAHVIEMLRAIPENLLTTSPRMWIGSFIFRRLTVDTQIMLAEAQGLLAWCDTTVDRDSVKVLRALVAYMLAETGDFEQSDAAFKAIVPSQSGAASSADALVAILWAAALTMRCNLTEATDVLKSVTGSMASSPRVAIALNRINVRRASMEGNWQTEKTFLLRCIDLAESIGPFAHAYTIHELADSAIVAGDRAMADQARAALRVVAERHNIKEYAAYSAIAGAPLDEDGVRFGSPVMRTRMHAMEAFYSGSVDEARVRLSAALEEAHASGGLFVGIILRAAMAELAPHLRDALIAEAQAICERLQAPKSLNSALTHLRMGDIPAHGEPMRGAVQHYRSMAHEKGAHVPVSLCVTKGTVERNGVPINVSRRVFDLLVALAVRQRAVERDELCEMLWADQDPQEAANALKMTIRRARIQTGDLRIVEISKNRYAIGEHVASDFRVMRRVCESALSDRSLLREKRDELFAFYGGIMTGIPSHLCEYEWFVGTNASLQNLGMELGAALGRDAIETNDTLWAAELAKIMFDADPCDELAWELRIRGLVQRGQTRAAVQAYNEYLRLIKESGLRPTLAPAIIDGLVADIA